MQWTSLVHSAPAKRCKMKKQTPTEGEKRGKDAQLTRRHQSSSLPECLDAAPPRLTLTAQHDPRARKILGLLDGPAHLPVDQCHIATGRPADSHRSRFSTAHRLPPVQPYARISSTIFYNPPESLWQTNWVVIAVFAYVTATSLRQQAPYCPIPHRQFDIDNLRQTWLNTVPLSQKANYRQLSLKAASRPTFFFCRTVSRGQAPGLPPNTADKSDPKYDYLSP